MQLQSSLLTSVVPYDSGETTSLVVELTAPASTASKNRPPVCVIACTDVSGSMSGPKIDNVKKSLLSLLDFMTEKDYFGLVTFSYQAIIRHNISSMTSEHKELAKSAINSLISDGGTNFYSGLETSFSMISHADLPKDCISRVIALTDGQANVGVVRANEIADKIRSQESKATVSAFGYGSDADQDLMASVASAGGGSFTYMDKANEAAEAFGKELGGLLLTTATDIEVNVTSKGENQVQEVVSVLKHKKTKDGITVFVPSMIDGQKLNIVLDVKLAKQGQHIPRAVSVFEVGCNYYGLDGANLVKKNVSTQKVKASFVKKKLVTEELDKRLAEIVLQQEAARAIADAEECANKRRDFQKSQDILNRFAQRALVWGFPAIQQIVLKLVPMYYVNTYNYETALFANAYTSASAGTVGTYCNNAVFNDFSKILGTADADGGTLRSFTANYVANADTK